MADGEVLGWLAEVVAAGDPGAEALPPPPPTLISRLGERVAGLAYAPPPLPELVARPCAAPAPAWHLRALRSLLADERAGAAHAARAGYHARWLSHLLRPDDAELLPRASVVIPVFNRADIVGDTIASALAQSHPGVEVIVVDDGSSDALDSALAPFRGRIRVVRQPNRGVSAARNHGVRLATGEYLQFLDSDNLLDRDAVATWIRAFAHVPDAELCYCHSRASGSRGAELQASERRPPTGGARCPTRDLLRVVVARYPFLNLGVLLPRWVVLEVGGFEERLRRQEDTRFWFALGCRDTKVVGLRRNMNTRHLLDDRLSTGAKDSRNRLAMLLLNFVDLLRSPKQWLHVGPYLRRKHRSLLWSLGDVSEAPLVVQLRGEVLGALSKLEESGRSAGLSALPVLRACADVAAESVTRVGASDGPPDPIHAGFCEAVERGLRRASAPGRCDVEYWLAAGSPSRANRAAVRAVLESVHASAFGDEPIWPLAELPALASAWPDHPWRNRWRGLAVFATLIGEARARRVLSRASRSPENPGAGWSDRGSKIGGSDDER